MRASIILFAFAEVAAVQPDVERDSIPVAASEDVCQFYDDCRSLTAGEKELAHSFYGPAIEYEAVRIVNGRYLGILPMGNYTGISPDGNIYAVADSVKSADYSAELHKAPFFIHELFHIKQYSEGVNLLAQAFGLHAVRSAGDPYAYQVEKGRAFSAYNIEQQARMAEDAFVLGHQLNSDGDLFAGVFAELNTQEKCLRWRVLEEVLATANVTIGPLPELCR